MFASAQATSRLINKGRISPFQIIRRTLSSISSSRSPSETITVPCQSNGTIKLEIYYPKGRQQLQNRQSAVGIFLPRGPVLEDSADDARNLSVLCATLRCTVVKVNYRYGVQFRYPTPIHDAVTGYDWVQRNLLPRRSIVRAGRSERVGSVAIFGELLGGQLSTMLALTECRIGEPGIVAAAVSNPITDWVSLDHALTVQGGQLSVPLLLHKRHELFRRPADYFDPFASPIHFFRTAGVAVPRLVVNQPLDDMSELTNSERDALYGEVPSVNGMSKTQTIVSAGEDVTNTFRKAILRYPSKAFGLRLPEFNITVGQRTPMLDQVKEFARHLRRSINRQRRLNTSLAETDGSDDNEAVLLLQSPDLGLWDHSEKGHERLLDVAQWANYKLQL